ncbi:hypothetical protein ElyMa_000862100 [Elysia marginata]|uniref:Uncharacterized protein n=1 Tax=Elysia marginata TaxID=1093978 RepID=A0AAV4H2P5_9GAST|nr:hypothetical protein ElyMa_000862100 [Elysia marginata]
MDTGLDTVSPTPHHHHHHHHNHHNTNMESPTTATTTTPTEDGEDPLLPGTASRSMTVSASGTDQNQNQCGVSPSETGANGSESPKKLRFTSEQSADKPDGRPETVNGETPPSDEELLRRLEEANRMLEADEKSRVGLTARSSTTPGHSRKGSGSSIVSSTSSNSFYSTQNSAENDDNSEVNKKGGEKYGLSPHHRHHHHHHHHLRIPQHQQQQHRNLSLVAPSPLRPRYLTHQRSASLDSRKSARSASDPISLLPHGGPARGPDDNSLTLRPPPSRMRRVGSSQNVGTETVCAAVRRKGSSGSLEKRGSRSVERPTSPSISDLLFGKLPIPPPHVAPLWEALSGSCGKLFQCPGALWVFGSLFFFFSPLISSYAAYNIVSQWDTSSPLIHHDPPIAHHLVTDKIK